MLNILYITIGFLFDLIVDGIFISDFSMNTAFFVPQFAFMALLLVSKRLSIFEMIIYGFVLGIFQDITNGTGLLFYSLINIIMLIIYYFWSKNLSETWFEQIMLLIAMVFLKELFIFAYYSIVQVVSFSLDTLFIKRLCLTIILSIPQAFIMMWLNDSFKLKIEKQRINRAASEDLFGHHFKR